MHLIIARLREGIHRGDAETRRKTKVKARLESAEVAEAAEAQAVAPRRVAAGTSAE
jgi:hypothetical protein